MRCPNKVKLFKENPRLAWDIYMGSVPEHAYTCLPIRASDRLVRCMDCHRHMVEHCDACFALAEDGSDDSCPEHTPCEWKIENE